MRRFSTCAIASLLSACASQPAPRRPAGPPVAKQNEKKADYVGPVWFDPKGDKVLRKSDQKTGKIAIDHKFAAQISVDGQRVADAPFAGELELVIGPHRLTVQEPGCAARNLDITVPDGQPPLPINTIGPCLPPGTQIADSGGGGAGDPANQVVYQQPSNTPAWIVTGVAAALAVAGGVFVGTYVVAANKRDKLIDEEPDRFDARPVRKADNEAFAYSIAAGSTFGAAAIAMGTAIVLFVTSTGEAPPDYNFGAGPNSLSFDLRF